MNKFKQSRTLAHTITTADRPSIHCVPSSSSVEVVGLDVGRDLGLPLVAVVEQLLLVVEQLLVRLGRELKVGPLDDGVDRARLLQTERKLGCGAQLHFV